MKNVSPEPSASQALDAPASQAAAPGFLTTGAAAPPLGAPVGLTRDAAHRYRWGTGEWVPGVTSVIKLLDKSGPLVGWATRTTAEAAIGNLPELVSIAANFGSQAAVDLLKRKASHDRDKSADLGTRVHALAEDMAHGRKVQPTEDEAPFFAAYFALYQRLSIQPIASEFMVYSDKHLYGGTADLAALIAGDLWLIDIKSGKSAYAETGLQLAGLRWADFCGKPGDPVRYRIPQTTRYGVIHVRPEGAELIPYSVGEQEFAAFLACRVLHRWTNERAQDVKGVAA